MMMVDNSVLWYT